MIFKKFEWRERKQQYFDKEKITLKKAGKEFNVYDFIQEGRTDTEIYPTLEKYGCIDRMMLDSKGTYDDFTKYGTLRDIKDQQKLAEQMFYNLPLETREHFNNNISTFMKEGENYLKQKISEESKKTETTNQTEIKTETKEVNNG